MKKTIGLCLIVKDEVKDVVRILSHYGKLFDCVYLTVTNKSKLEEFQTLPKLMDDVRILVSYFEWTKNFSEARNFNFAQAETDYIFWMDADDKLHNASAMRGLITRHEDVDVFYFNYQYAFDESGNCTMQHTRERLIRNNKTLMWKGAVHETLIPIEDVQLRSGQSDEVQVIHTATLEDCVDSHKRNVEILVSEYNREGEKTDPRSLSYLAAELTALKRYDEAIKFYEKHIQLSGWEEDKYLSWNKIAQNLVSMFMEHGDKKLLATAIAALSEAIIMFPQFPDAYLTMGEVYWHLREWEKAIEWTNTGLSKKPDTTLPYHDPTRYTIRPLPILAFAHLNLGNIELAYQLMSEAMKRAPKNPFVVNNFPFFEKSQKELLVFKNFINIAAYLENNDRDKLNKLPDLIPNDCAGDDRFIQLRHKYSKPKVWDADSVVIYCGLSAEEWAPPSVLKGIGGSEEAVIYLSKELTALGHKVTVYANCGDLEGDYDGVEYKNYWHFNKHDVFNVIISWRQNIFNAGVFGKRKLVWLHDVPFKNDWTAEAFENVDKVIVLSDYHKTLLPNAPEDKIYVSTNGINVPDMVLADSKKHTRNPYRIIYGSSYNRGLEHLLDMWSEIRQEVPMAELHVFYGWETFDAMNSENQDLMRWKESLIKKMNQPGIKDHGRVGHRKLLEEYAKSAIWAYPTFFKEINCITALKATAMGCMPVFHNQFALRDTCKYGYGVEPKEEKLMLEEFKQKLITALHVPYGKEPRESMKIAVRNQYSWVNVARDWSANLFNENLDLCVSDKN
jgi:tetratricopeptide (TPR) repeat protein